MVHNDLAKPLSCQTAFDGMERPPLFRGESKRPVCRLLYAVCRSEDDVLHYDLFAPIKLNHLRST